jgi:acetyl-CoA carboxylase carboxyl transferase subunit alpha
LTAADAKKLGVIDEIIGEPLGGAHRDHNATAQLIKATIENQLASLEHIPGQELLDLRLQKFLDMGIYDEVEPAGGVKTL